jgi:hypothetical protein
MKNFLAGLAAFFASLANPVTVDQYMGLLRQLLPAIGGFVVALGWLPSDVMNAKVQLILSMAGPAMILAGGIWSMFANNKTSIIKAAAKMPETQQDGNSIVITDPALAQAAKSSSEKAGKPNG